MSDFETVRVLLADGTPLDIKVEPGTSDDEIRRRIDESIGRVETSNAPFDKNAYYRQLNKDMSPFWRFATGFDRGVTRLGQGLMGKEEPDSVRAASRDLTQNYASGMAGDILGKTAPLLPLAAVGTPGVVAGRALPAATTTLGRIGAAAAAGAVEGGLIAQSEGQNVGRGASAGGAIAATAEAVIPVLGRLAGQFYRRATGRTPRGGLITPSGNPTEELSRALDQAGVRFDDLKDEALDFIARQEPGASPEQVARAARFRNQGIDATHGQVTQDFTQQAKEARLAEMISDSTAEPLRERLATVSNQFTDAVEGFAGSMGSSRLAGESVKEAISTAKVLARKKKNELYQQAARLAEQVGGVPLPVDDIASAIPKDFSRRARLLPSGEVKAFNELMVEFGIDQSDEAVEAFTKSGGKITPLSIENAEEFRQALRNFNTGTGDSARRWQSLTGDVIRSFDETLDATADVIDGGSDVGRAFKAARAANREYMVDFSPNDLAGRLSGLRPDGSTPIVEASQVMQQFRSRPVEQLQRTLATMAKAGDQGKKAVQNMRAAVVLEALEEATKAPSNKYGGKQMANTPMFSKFLDQRFGRDRLELLFKGNEKALKQLEGLMQSGLDLAPPAKAMPKGSAAVNADIWSAFRQKIGPVLYAALTPIRAVGSAGVEKAQVNRALSPLLNPKQIANSYPGVAALMGIQYVAEEDER